MLVDLRTRFWSKVQMGEGCWEWTAYRNSRTGYGSFKLGVSVPAHRVAYALVYGPIPAGLTIDHLCRNQICQRPTHLEAVTQQTNILRGNTLAATNAGKTHCPQGHPFDEENTYRCTNGARRCRACQYASDRRYKERQHRKERVHVG